MWLLLTRFDDEKVDVNTDRICYIGPCPENPDLTEIYFSESFSLTVTDFSPAQWTEIVKENQKDD
jgi:hypothetical protein